MTRREYEHYLKTAHWIRFSQWVKHRRPNCEKCGLSQADSRKLWRQDLNVHHKTYERIGKEKPEDVTVLCWLCHMGQHDELISDLAKLFLRKRIEPIEPCVEIVCVNCGKLYPRKVYVGDEFEWLCWECKAA